MALTFLQVLVLAATAAALHDVPITWSHSGRAALACVVASWERVQLRRQPPPLDEERARTRPFVWRKNGTELSSKRISSNGTLEVSKKRDGEGVYQCAVHHGHHGRLILGYPVNLKFAYMDKQFSIQPANGTVRAGQPAALRCEITSGPPATIIWEKDGRILGEDARHHILANDLIITDVTREDAGSYRCKATNPHLNRMPVSHVGKLEVEEAQDQDVSFLSIHHEENITAARGTRVVLPCPVMGWPRPKLIWEHTPPVGRTSELEETSEVLILSKLEYDQEGLYTCSVEGHSDLAKSFNVTLTEPVNITLPPVSKEALRASTVRFNCTATGRPQPVVTWYKDGQPLELLGRFNLRTSIDKERIELVISGLISDDAGIYQCFASNPTSVASGWAQLSVRGGPKAAAPAEVTCAPVGPRRVEVRWLPASQVVTAYYTVYVTPRDKPGSSNNGQPRIKPEENVTLSEALTPYSFQVRAFIPISTENARNIASDMSEGVVCQGQGVPITLIKLDKDSVMVSWKKFADQNPGVVEWILQHKAKSDMQERNITLDGAVYNYTLHAPESDPQLVRVLGSRSYEWLPQNLTLVPWSSTASAGQDLDDGDITVVPDEIYAVDIEQRSFGLKWTVEDSDRYSYMVCVRRVEGIDDCRESLTSSATVEGLQPDSEYEVRIQARIPGRALGGPFSRPLLVTTKHEGPLRFKELRYKFVNSSSLRVSWSGSPARYTVRHSSKLVLPVDEWATVETTHNTVLIHGLNPVEQTFVMVTGYDPEENSQILNIPAQMKDLDAKDLQYSYSANGVTVWCSGAGPRVVRFAQNITLPVEKWHTLNVTDCTTESSGCELTELDPSLPVYVMLVPSRSRNNQVLTIPPRPPAPFNYHLWLAIAGGLCLLGLLVIAVVCVWRRRKRMRSPDRTRRRTSVNDTVEEEGAEMKGTSSAGDRLANGGMRDAGEPLLNGHVHITENPGSKTPNGRMKKGRRYDAFDMSRTDADTTMETTLDDSLPALLDTSRRPEFEHRSSRDVTKLPDDNMNSELNSSDFLDSSTIQPTLQPNG